MALVAIRKALDLESSNIFVYPQKKIVWIHPRETITKQEYNAQVQMSTQFILVPQGKDPILVSLGDAIQILTIIQKKAKNIELIRKLIIKIEDLQKQLNKQVRKELKFLVHLLEQFDDIAHDFIKSHGKNKWEGYKLLWEDTIWSVIIDIIYKRRSLLGLPNPPRRHTGLHHLDKNKPYYRIYPHIATKGKLIDKRHENHEDPRNKKYWI